MPVIGTKAKYKTIIKMTHPLDIAFSRIAQGAFLRETTLPSGFKTPDVPMIFVGDELRVISEAEYEAKWGKDALPSIPTPQGTRNPTRMG